MVQATFFLLRSRMMVTEIGAHMNHKSFQGVRLKDWGLIYLAEAFARSGLTLCFCAVSPACAVTPAELHTAPQSHRETQCLRSKYSTSTPGKDVLEILPSPAPAPALLSYIPNPRLSLSQTFQDLRVCVLSSSTG